MRNACLSSDSVHAEDMQAFLSAFDEALPLQERVLNRLADLLLCADDVLGTIARDAQAYRFAACERLVRGVYNSVNDYMKEISD
jgi:hypothetical protein